MSDTAGQALEKLAHDLRTPLTALKMAVGLIVAKRKHSTDADEVALLQALQRNVGRMEDVVADLSALVARAAERK